jgi:hypothetical protein
MHFFFSHDDEHYGLAKSLFNEPLKKYGSENSNKNTTAIHVDAKL